MRPAPSEFVVGDALGAVGQEEAVQQRRVVRVRHVGGGVGTATDWYVVSQTTSIGGRRGVGADRAATDRRG